MFPRNIQEVESPEIPSGAIAGLIDSRRNQQGNPSVSKKAVMLEMIKESCAGVSTSQLQMPVKDNNGAPFPPKTLFLTVTATRVEAGQLKQLYRIDIPMREIAHDRAHSSHSSPSRHDHQRHSHNQQQHKPSHVCQYEVIKEVAAQLDGKGSAQNFSKIRIYPPKQMILLPALPANVTIYLTVSEVVDWPRAYLVGQSSLHGDNYLIWRQVVSLSQGISTCDMEDLPKNDSHSRLQIHIPTLNTAQDEEEDSFSRAVTAEGSRASKKKAKRTHIVGGRILWTLIPSSFIASIAGPLFFLPQASIASSKKRCWCVVLEGCLIVYGHMIDIRTKEIIDLSVCTVHMLEAEVMKIHRSKSVDGAKGPDQTWFCFCATPGLRPEWYKILRESSLKSKKGKKTDMAAMLLNFTGS